MVHECPQTGNSIGCLMDIVMKEFISFEWDERKRLINLAKHGIDFEDAAEALYEPHIEYRLTKTERSAYAPFARSWGAS